MRAPLALHASVKVREAKAALSEVLKTLWTASWPALGLRLANQARYWAQSPAAS